MYYIIYWKAAKKVDLKISYHKKKQFVTLCDNGC